jgi:hypothetical protein
MKKMILTPVLAAIIALGTTALAQEKPKEYLGLPGDNLNLYAVMDLFQKSPTLEGFEKSLNDESTRINNLDLNSDNEIDYISVNDFVDGNTHSIVLRDILGKDQSQDVAVFTVQKNNNGSVDIQLIGDEALYGENYIIEPNNQNGGATPNPGYQGNVNVTNVTIVNDSPFNWNSWPLVTFMYRSDYSVWHSRWYWGYYPGWWRPWRPYYWDFYYGYHYHYFPGWYAHYRHWDRCRWDRYHDFYYTGVRAHSIEVERRINEGRYNTTYSRPAERIKGEDLYIKNNPGVSARREFTSESVNRESVNRPQVNRNSNERDIRTNTQNTRERTSNMSRQNTNNSNDRATVRTETQRSTREQPATRERSERSYQAPSSSRQKSETVKESRSSTSRSHVSKPSSSKSESRSSSSRSKSGKSSESKSSKSERRK